MTSQCTQNGQTAEGEIRSDHLIEDENLMARIQEGDADALRLFVVRHRKMLRYAILRTVHDDASAEDVLQECLLDLWRNSRHYDRSKGQPLAWMMTLCRRRAIDHLRRSVTYCRVKARMEQSLAENPPRVNSGSDEGDSSDIRNLLANQMALLPPAQAKAVTLAFVNGMSQREVAEATHTPLGTVKTRIELGLRKLRHLVKDRHNLTFRSRLTSA